MRLDTSIYNLRTTCSSVIEYFFGIQKYRKGKPQDRVLAELKFTSNKIHNLVDGHKLANVRKITPDEKPSIMKVCEQIIDLDKRYTLAVGKIIDKSPLCEYNGYNWARVGLAMSEKMQYIKPILNSLKEPNHHCMHLKGR